jgi:hypothetical protein
MSKAEARYAELRTLLAQWIPRQTRFGREMDRRGAVKEKGRKSNYFEFKLDKAEWIKNERLLDSSELKSFAEISLRSAACPMCLNIDVYDALLCIAKGTIIETTFGPILIENVEIGDEVLTMNEKTKETEWKPVLFKSSSIKTDMIELETEEGKLHLTGDHPVYTQRGWIKAGDLTIHDELHGVK